MDEDLFDTRDSPRTRSMVIAAVQWTSGSSFALGSDALRTVKCSEGSLAAAFCWSFLRAGIVGQDAPEIFVENNGTGIATGSGDVHGAM
jgi:hypothetical protein